MFRKIVVAVLAICAVSLGGCATERNYKQAFSETTALKANSSTYEVPVDKTFKAVKATLVRQGFTIEQADTATGLIKATRNFQDPKDQELSYNIIATADINAAESGSMVTLAASQQTIMHRTWHEWWHLLWIIPIFPISTEYQTVVTHEGNITESSFYTDFFAAVGKTLAPAPAATAPQAAPAPAQQPATGKLP